VLGATPDEEPAAQKDATYVDDHLPVPFLRRGDFNRLANLNRRVVYQNI